MNSQPQIKVVETSTEADAFVAKILKSGGIAWANQPYGESIVNGQWRLTQHSSYKIEYFTAKRLNKVLAHGKSL